MNVRRVRTTTLEIAYEVSGPDDGAPAILLHGWPDDVRTWDRVAPRLHEAGVRTFAPWLRGYGETRFLDPATMRSGQFAALAQDVVDFADALDIARFHVVGHDWGARVAYVLACAFPERVARCCALSVGWGTNDPDQSLSLGQVQRYWYHWYMALERGERLVRDDRRALATYMWTIWNPNWTIPPDELERTLRAFDNPDWADVVLHSYRVRWGHAAGDPAFAALEERVRRDPVIAVPALVVHGGSDPVNDPATSEGKERFFAGPYRRVVLDGVGHFPQRERADALCAELVPFLRGDAATFGGANAPSPAQKARAPFVGKPSVS